MDKIIAALAQYGASLTDDGRIQRGDKVLSVLAIVKKGRIRFESLSAGLIASGPIEESTVEKFVESFWFWKKN